MMAADRGVEQVVVPPPALEAERVLPVDMAVGMHIDLLFASAQIADSDDPAAHAATAEASNSGSSVRTASAAC